MDSTEKIKIMKATVEPILKMLEKRKSNKIQALQAYDVDILSDSEIKKMREIEAIKLRHEVDVLNDLTDIVNAMFP